ncbi:MAG TPA: ATP-binding protein [Vicinamibacterales bacterium]|nr:ATP-binding protein [Vicinamibacterales bacterium]
MRLGFRFRLFVGLSLVAAAAVSLAALLVGRALARETLARIERGLVSEARLAAELVSTGLRDTPPGALDDEADRLGEIVAARVTFIAADGTVLGDSAEDGEALRALENHGRRPEVLAARRTGLGVVRRYSTTVGHELLYVAVPARHPSVAIVRLALPLTEIQAQVRAVRRATGVALAVALGLALGLAWMASALLAARVQAVAAAARRYARGDLSSPAGDYGADEIGQLGRVLDETVRDLAGRMAELDRARGRMEAILAGMVEGVIVVDGDGRVQLVNRSARELLGMGEVEGVHYLRAVRHPDVAAQFDAALAGREPRDMEIELPGGRTVAARAVPLAQGGAVLVLHDITRLRQADRIRRDFVANVSHELRTPLTAIHGYAEALADDALAPAERERFLEIIRRHARRMERLVRDLLRLARLEAGQEPVERAPCAIADLFERTIADLRPQLEARRQRVTVAVAPGAERLVTDAAKLEDILKNLVENAAKYSPEGSEIRLEAIRRDGRYEVSVLDEGPGIPAADLTRVFERFYRVDKARSRDSGGTGLGLSIVKHLAEILGGEVEAANRPEGGARFTVRLPEPAA